MYININGVWRLVFSLTFSHGVIRVETHLGAFVHSATPEDPPHWGAAEERYVTLLQRLRGQPTFCGVEVDKLPWRAA